MSFGSTLVLSFHPCIATLPLRESMAKVRCSVPSVSAADAARAMLIAPSFSSANPKITRFAPRASNSLARATSRMPPPVWQGSRLQIIVISSRLLPRPMAASRSMSWTRAIHGEALNPIFKVVKL